MRWCAPFYIEHIFGMRSGLDVHWRMTGKPDMLQKINFFLSMALLPVVGPGPIFLFLNSTRSQ
jgi:hypothetical protein